jgi:hypothetical protein
MSLIIALCLFALSNSVSPGPVKLVTFSSGLNYGFLSSLPKTPYLSSTYYHAVQYRCTPSFSTRLVAVPLPCTGSKPVTFLQLPAHLPHTPSARAPG